MAVSRGGVQGLRVRGKYADGRETGGCAFSLRWWKRGSVKMDTAVREGWKKNQKRELS